MKPLGMSDLLKIIIFMLGTLIGVVIIGGLGAITIQVINLHGRVCSLEARLPADFEQRFRELEKNVAVIRELTTRVNNLNTRVSELNPAKGRIVSPSNGDTVPPVFNYEIELLNPDETKFYYIVNRIDGLYWPKVMINLRSGVTIYKGTSNEGGSSPDGRFSVVLFEVDAAMHENIVRWMDRTNFPGIQINGRELASVDVVLRK
jgi:hypothetical protein